VRGVPVQVERLGEEGKKPMCDDKYENGHHHAQQFSLGDRPTQEYPTGGATGSNRPFFHTGRTAYVKMNKGEEKGKYLRSGPVEMAGFG
jgi:hypothetical protein